MEREEGGPDAALALYADWPVRSVVPHRLGRRGRAGRAPQSAEPGAGSAGPGAAQRRRLI
jgi:hypothetical protein